jgi:dihydroorotate dehydrogenase subfamily 1
MSSTVFSASNRKAEILSAKVLGLTLANPVIVASGAFSDSLQQIRRAFDAGAGAVVTKTIYSGQKDKTIERVKKTPLGAFNSTTYSRVGFDRWISIIASMAEKQKPVIASIFAQTPELLRELARRVVDAGSPALELGLSCPNDPTQQGADLRFISQYTAAVRKAVCVPFSVKLSAAGDIVNNVQAALNEGADAISLSDALPSILMDVDHRSVAFGGPVAYSGPAIKPIVLHSIYEIRQAGIKVPIMGIGGVSSVTDVLEYLQLGADVVQVYTVLMTRGVEFIKELVDDLYCWCDKREASIGNLIGIAVRK